MTSPQVSVVVIAFNEEERIEACLTALIAQETQFEFEILVVDDGSLDNTVSIVRRLQESEPRVRLICHEFNLGRGAARKRGQDESAGSKIGFVDADIEVPKDWIERCAIELSRCSAVSGLACPDGDCAVIWRLFKLEIRERRGPAGITGGNVMFNAEVLELEPFDAKSKLGEDFRQAKRLAARGMKLTSLVDLKVIHRESRSYFGAIRWMWALGVDAASLPFEFKIFRIPDLTWLVWIGSTALLSFLVAIGQVSGLIAVASFILLTFSINVAYIYTRFDFRAHTARWVASVFANFPLMFVYLLGRTWGISWLMSPRRRRQFGL